MKGHAPFAGSGLVGGACFRLEDCEGETILYDIRYIVYGMQWALEVGKGHGLELNIWKVPSSSPARQLTQKFLFPISFPKSISSL